MSSAPVPKHLNTILAINVAQEYVQAAICEDGTYAVGFFQENVMQFCTPVKDDTEAVNLAIRFQEMFVAAINRYMNLGGR